MKTTRETREVIKGLGAVAARFVRVNEDGKVTFGEKLGFVGDVPEVMDAIKGIAEVPAELADLDEGERVILVGDIKLALIAAGVSHRNSDIAEWILEWAYGTVRSMVLLVHRIKTAPPTALQA